jgi:hypothetical protein
MRSVIHITAATSADLRRQVVEWAEAEAADATWRLSIHKRPSLQTTAAYNAEIATLNRVAKFWRDVVIDDA